MSDANDDLTLEERVEALEKVSRRAVDRFHTALGELSDAERQAYIWKRLAVALFDKVTSLTGTGEFGVNLDPSMPWPDVVLNTFPNSATLTREYARGGIIRGPLNAPTGGCVVDTSKRSSE